VDILCALSTCPGGDLSQFGWGEEAVDMLSCCRPLGIEVFDVEEKSVLKDWKPPESPRYNGMHGMTMPVFTK
jgi:uncharacterized protein YcgI (DUF1989 family)